LTQVQTLQTPQQLKPSRFPADTRICRIWIGPAEDLDEAIERLLRCVE
jgi:hypothetical protein